jgi:ribonuclease III
MLTKINYTFNNKTLFDQAITHPSAVKGSNISSYERLEFLGDSIISMVISELLYTDFPNATEGELSIMHAKLVNTKTLSEIANNIELGEHLIMDIGEDINMGRLNLNNLENALEALIGAMYLDSNFSKVKEIILSLWENYLVKGMELAEKDVKSKLQEVVQKKYKNIPIYSVIEKTGLDHSPLFKVSVSIVGYGSSAVGEGRSKKEAEVAAATNMLNMIKELL